MKISHPLIGLLVAVGCGSATPARAPEPPAPSISPAPTPTPGPLEKLNQLFRDSYNARRESVRASTAPVIVVSGSDLRLYRPGAAKGEPVEVIPKVFHSLKAVAHLPFAIYLKLSPVAGTPLPDAVRAGLPAFLERIQAAREAVPTEFAPEQRSRQFTILDVSEKLLNDVLVSGRVERSALQHIAKTLGRLMLENARDAGCAQVTGTHAQVMKWKKGMTTEEWRALRVMNRGMHQARYRSAATQYFAWLLGDESPEWAYPGESMRVTFTEFLPEKQDSRHLLATVIIDADASEAFFGDPWRLTEDVLSEGAEHCISRLTKE
jgi:hypothetical protein